MLVFLMVLSGCDVDDLLKKMLDYYSNDDNYANYVGTLVSVDKEHCYVEIVCQDDEMPNQTCIRSMEKAVSMILCVPMTE